MAGAFIGLGSNLGNRLQLLRDAVRLLNNPAIRVRRLSGVYECPPCGFTSEFAFLNAVVEVQTDLEPFDLLAALQSIERRLGRQRPDKADSAYADRTIDLDLLDYDGRSMELYDLLLPHPQAQARAFVLRPWCDVAPDARLHDRSVCDWLAALPAAEVEAVQRLEGVSLS